MSLSLGPIFNQNTRSATMWLEQQIEAEELSNSILIEISKAAVKKWQEKLNNRFVHTKDVKHCIA